ncbi:cystathionine gamma-synthase [Rarobacter faecitabidus]|uniref:Cystathionine gamma-lyase n=2 Tax=Rarobacter faecitabidus TaxID=13243 RepID=A0A542ZU83_RARFA|nr:cystathionine gamma-lyase [Rarobacter faecitabidus]
MSGFATRAIHEGQEPDPSTGAVIPPLYLSSTYAQERVGEMRAGYDYARAGHPTRTAFESVLTALEGGEATYSFASGLAAEDALLRAVLRPGDHIVIPSDAYGGTYRLLSRIYGEWGIELTAANSSNPDEVASAIRPGQTKLVWVETPSNPLLGIADIAAIAAISKDAGALLVVDNTFATPALQRPLEFGADAVVHSTTKYIGGHSDVIGGAVVIGRGVELTDGRNGGTGTPSVADAVKFQQFAAGAGQGPLDLYLTHRGIKTLDVRMARHSENAAVVADALVEWLGADRVLYPGLAGHPGHEIAARQMSSFGGMVSFLAGSPERARRIVESTKVFTLAESLGGVESLIEYPYAMTHASVVGSQLEVPHDLVRVSVGIETVADLVADLEQAIAK